MRRETSALLGVLTFVGLALIANAKRSSSDVEQIDLVEFSNATSSSRAGENEDEMTDVALGDSRIGIGGESFEDGQKLSEWKSILWCPTIRNNHDGHLCGWMMWITEKHFMASNPAIFTVQGQLSPTSTWFERTQSETAGWVSKPPTVLDVSKGIPNSNSDDWKYRFMFRKTIAHDIGVYRLVGHKSLGYADRYGPFLSADDGDLLDQYDLGTSSGYRTDEIPCYVTVYGSDKGKSDNTRRLRWIDIEEESCNNGECQFKTVDREGRGQGELCGEYSDVGAPIDCRPVTSHIVTKLLLTNGTCTNRFMAMELYAYRKELKSVEKDDDLKISRKDKPNSP